MKSREKRFNRWFKNIEYIHGAILFYIDHKFVNPFDLIKCWGITHVLKRSLKKMSKGKLTTCISVCTWFCSKDRKFINITSDIRKLLWIHILHTLIIQKRVFFKLISACTWFRLKDRIFMNNLNIRKLLQMHILHFLNWFFLPSINYSFES